MQVTITGRHLNVTDAMREHARERAERLASHFDRLVRVEVTLDIDGSIHAAEMIGSLRRGGQPLVAHARGNDMYAVIDAAADKLETQVRRQKDKVKDHRVHRPAGEGVMAREEESAPKEGTA